MYVNGRSYHKDDAGAWTMGSPFGIVDVPRQVWRLLDEIERLRAERAAYRKVAADLYQSLCLTSNERVEYDEARGEVDIRAAEIAEVAAEAGGDE